MMHGHTNKHQIQSRIYCVLPVVGRASSALMVKEETKLAV